MSSNNNDNNNNNNIRKYNFFNEIYNKQYCVFVHFNGNYFNNKIPNYLHKEVIVFQYGKNLPTPITEFNVTYGGIYATLSFNRTLCKTFVDWRSVYGIADENQKFYPFSQPNNKSKKSNDNIQNSDDDDKNNVINFFDAVKRLKNKKK